MVVIRMERERRGEREELGKGKGRWGRLGRWGREVEGKGGGWGWERDTRREWGRSLIRRRR